MMQASILRQYEIANLVGGPAKVSIAPSDHRREAHNQRNDNNNQTA
jgi:hypothetical protein